MKLVSTSVGPTSAKLVLEQRANSQTALVENGCQNIIHPVFRGPLLSDHQSRFVPKARNIEPFERGCASDNFNGIGECWSIQCATLSDSPERVMTECRTWPNG